MILRVSAVCLLILCATPSSSYAADRDSVQRSLDFTAEQEKYRAAIAELQSDQGPASASLIEPIAALTELSIETGQIAEALGLLEQQLQIYRVNNGLYSAEQVPVIEKMMKLNARLQDWGKVSLGVDHLSWLHARDEDTPVPDRLAAIQRLRDWHMLLLNHDIREREALHLLRIREISKQSLELARQHYGKDDPALVEFLHERAQSELYIALAMALTSDTGSLLITQTEGIAQTGLQPAGGQYVTINDIEMTYGPRASTVIDRSFRNAIGRHLSHLTEIHDFYQERGDTEAQAMAMIHMADSVLMREQYQSQGVEFAGRQRGQGNIGSAARMYEAAAALLLTSGIDPAAVTRFFSCPVLLPVNRFSPEFPDNVAGCTPDQHYDLGDIHLLVESVPGPAQSSTQSVAENISSQTFSVVEFTVPGNGQPSRINVLSAEPDSTRNRARARDVIERLQFRPALREGSPETHENVRMRLVLPAD